MKKRLISILLIIFPYAYIIFFLLAKLISKIGAKWIDSEMQSNLFILITVIYVVLAFVFSIYNAVSCARGNISAYETAKINRNIKCWHIPAYIFHFFIGCFGLIMGPFGIGIILFVFIINAASIFISGINSIGCAVKLKKENVLSPFSAFVGAVGSFIFFIDIFVSIIYVILCKRNRSHSYFK